MLAAGVLLREEEEEEEDEEEEQEEEEEEDGSLLAIGVLRRVNQYGNKKLTAEQGQQSVILGLTMDILHRQMTPTHTLTWQQKNERNTHATQHRY